MLHGISVRMVMMIYSAMAHVRRAADYMMSAMLGSVGHHFFCCEVTMTSRDVHQWVELKRILN